MKVAAVVLSLLVLSLNAIPCCWEECSGDSAIEHSEQNKGSEDSCSPFLSCGSCSGFVIDQNLPDIPSFKALFQLQDEQLEVSFQSDYSIEIWQPPRMI